MLKNHVAVILDRSSSMESIRDATIKAFNEQVQSIKLNSRGQQTDVSLFTFSTRPDAPTFFTASVDSLQELTRDTYVPNGSTALYDTVLEATRLLGNLADANDPETSFLVIIQSDGEENVSQASGTDVSKRLEALQATNRWTFTYLGCSQGDLTRMRAMGISAGNSRGFAYSNEGVASTSALNCSASSSYFAARASGSTSVNNLYDVAEAQLNVVPPVNIVSVVDPNAVNLSIGGTPNLGVSCQVQPVTPTPKLIVDQKDKTPPSTT